MKPYLWEILFSLCAIGLFFYVVFAAIFILLPVVGGRSAALVAFAVVWFIGWLIYRLLLWLYARVGTDRDTPPR